MGEAKNKKRGEINPHQNLTEEFIAAGIDCNEYGFFNQAAFIEREQQDPAYLEKYAKWVSTRPISPEYDKHVREVVPRLAGLVAAALAEDDMQGGCVAAASMISAMLDRLGVWSYGIVGSANLYVDSLKIVRHLHIVDEKDFPDAALGHSWIAAPPYLIVDASMAEQHWGRDAIKAHIPPVILADGVARTIRPTVDDVVSDRVQNHFAARERRHDTQLHHRLEPRLKSFGSDFPAHEVAEGELRLRYVPVAIRMSDCPLEEINAGGSIGRPALEIWQEVVAPAFGQ